MPVPRGAETVEMIDGRTYFSTDNWQTVWLVRAGEEKPRRISGRAADLARFLAVSQASAGP